MAHWRENHHHDRVAVMMLSAQKSDVYGRSKFYGTSTRDALVRPNELVQLYNNNVTLKKFTKNSHIFSFHFRSLLFAPASMVRRSIT